MSLPASTVTVTFQDSDGQQTQRVYEGRVAALTDAQAVALADNVQALTQLEVVDLQISRRVAGFTPIAAEANSSVAETASLKVELDGGGFHSFNLPALKAAFKSGATVNGNDAAIATFLANFDNGDGVGATEGNFFVSDGEKISEAYVEGGKVSGKVNR